MTPDKEGNLPPSALVPFCSYQEDSSFLGKKRPELGNITMCDKFKPTIFEGQLCYSLDIAKLDGESSKSGKANGLFLLLDPDPYQLNHGDIQVKKQHPFKLYIHTLGQFSVQKSGYFAMSSLKEMTGTKSFKQLPDKQKKCTVHKREECFTQRYLDQLENKCGCLPWALVTGQQTQQVETSNNKKSK